jgi:hypothetical protein
MNRNAKVLSAGVLFVTLVVVCAVLWRTHGQPVGLAMSGTIVLVEGTLVAVCYRVRWDIERVMPVVRPVSICVAAAMAAGLLSLGGERPDYPLRALIVMLRGVVIPGFMNVRVGGTDDTLCRNSH